jgi:hypothetical protein
MGVYISFSRRLIVKKIKWDNKGPIEIDIPKERGTIIIRLERGSSKQGTSYPEDSLKMELIQKYPDGNYTILKAIVNEQSVKDDECFNDAKIETFCGTNSENDRLHFVRWTRDKLDNLFPIDLVLIGNDLWWNSGESDELSPKFENLITSLEPLAQILHNTALPLPQIQKFLKGWLEANKGY